MKHFLIKYRFEHGSVEEWHQHIATFIAGIEADPELDGRIAYRCAKSREGVEYWHLASAVDETVIKTLQSRDWFKRYNEHTRAVAGGGVEVVPLEIIAETSHRA